MCRRKQMHAAATRFYVSSFAADPRLADHLDVGIRYAAACSAAQAAAAQGQDADELTGTDRLALRRRALTWLRADLAARQKQLKSTKPGEADKASAALRRWQKDPDLAGLRDAEALKKLSEEERQACRKFWAEVRGLLGEAKDTPSRP